MTRKNTLEMPEFEKAGFELFQTVQILDRWRFIAHIVFFATAIISMFTTDYLLYITAIVALITRIIAFLLRLNASSIKALGHSLHRISMLAKAYDLKKVNFDVDYLTSKIPPKILHNAIKTSKSADISGKYSPPVREAGADFLRWMIQQNAFFNRILYEICAAQALRILQVFSAIVILTILLIIPITNGANEYIVFRIVLIILSLAILYDQVERWISWRSASREMLNLENELARFKTVPEHRVLLLFSNYHVVLYSTPGIGSKVYDDNREQLNARWEQRKATLYEEWSNGS